MFQAPVLYDWRTVEANVGLPLEVIGRPRPERDQRVRALLRLVGLDAFRRHYPWQLSGGCSGASPSPGRDQPGDPADGRAVRRARRDDARAPQLGAPERLPRDRRDRALRDPASRRRSLEPRGRADASPGPDRARGGRRPAAATQREDARLPRFFELVTLVREHLVEDPAISASRADPRGGSRWGRSATTCRSWASSCSGSPCGRPSSSPSRSVLLAAGAPRDCGNPGANLPAAAGGGLHVPRGALATRSAAAEAS